MAIEGFIFSTERQHKWVRHIVFWTVWWGVYFLFFHLPQHAIYGWNLNEVNVNLEENGAWWILKMMVFNVLLGVIVPQVIFTYTLLYYVLPRYFYRESNWGVRFVVLMGFTIAYFFVSGCFKALSQLPNYWLGLRTAFPWPNKVSFFAALRDTLTSLPLVAGLALAIKLLKRWWLEDKETRQIAGEKIKAELQLLKAQVHPHFLFNTLNNIYSFTLSGSSKAPEMIKKLSDMLNYILKECTSPWVTLDKEIKMIEDYVALEKVRYGEQMDLSFELSDNLISNNVLTGKKLIAPLLLIPFVENSFKHGASKMLNQAYIKLRMTVDKNELHFFISNKCPMGGSVPLMDQGFSDVSGGVGLNNVKKRLQLLYPNTHSLTILSEQGNFTVSLNIQLYNAKLEGLKDLSPIIAYDRA